MINYQATLILVQTIRIHIQREQWTINPNRPTHLRRQRKSIWREEKNREYLMRYNTVESITLNYLPSVPKLNTRTRVRSRY